MSKGSSCLVQVCVSYGIDMSVFVEVCMCM